MTQQIDTNRNESLKDFQIVSAKEQALKAQQELEDLPRASISLSSEKNKNRPLSELSTIKYSSLTSRTNCSEFVVIDTETTGLNAARDKIIELCAVRFRDGKPVEVYETLINPQKPIPPEASAVNHITQDDIAHAPTIKEVLASFDQFVGNSDIVGHNLEFDLKFIHHAGSKLIDTKRRYFCTLKISQKILKRPKTKWNSELECYETDYDGDWDVYDHKLGTLCEYFGIFSPAQHRAAGDAIVTGKLFIKLLKEKQSHSDSVNNPQAQKFISQKDISLKTSQQAKEKPLILPSAISSEEIKEETNRCSTDKTSLSSKDNEKKKTAKSSKKKVSKASTPLDFQNRKKFYIVLSIVWGILFFVSIITAMVPIIILSAIFLTIYIRCLWRGRKRAVEAFLQNQNKN